VCAKRVKKSVEEKRVERVGEIVCVCVKKRNKKKSETDVVSNKKNYWVGVVCNGV